MSRISSGSLYGLLALFIALHAGPAAAEQQGRIVAFGDSLSDSGNYYAAFGTVSVAPFAPVPDSPYAIGGFHYSNGATWLEAVAAALDRSSDARPALRAPGRYSNYAVGRARARPDADAFPGYDLSTQVGLFLRDAHGAAPVDALYVIWIGANDINDALRALPADPTGQASGAILEAAVTAVADNLVALWASGARSFLILNVPDLALTPAVRATGPGGEYYATLLTAAFDGGVDHALAALRALPGATIDTVDINAQLHAIAANPSAFGLTDVAVPCLRFGTVTNPMCADPGQVLFWDAIHPTRAGHQLIARAALGPIRTIFRRHHWEMR